MTEVDIDLDTPCLECSCDGQTEMNFACDCICHTSDDLDYERTQARIPEPTICTPVADFIYERCNDVMNWIHRFSRCISC